MEYLDIVDEKGNPTGQIVTRETAHSEGILHRTAHLWLLRKKDDVTQILVQKRSADKAEFPGCFDISSAGHIPAGMDYEESALRELQEELGITAEKGELIWCGDRDLKCDTEFRGVPFHDRQHTRVYLMWCSLDADKFTLQKEEVELVRWLSFGELMEAVRENLIKHCIAMEELEMICRFLMRHAE